VVYVALTKAIFGGDTETFFLYVTPAVTGGVAYLWNVFSFLLTDRVAAWRGKQARRISREELDDLGTTLEKARQTLIALRDTPGVSTKRKREINQDIAELERLFADRVKDRLRQ
jgi:hypothetical protein